MVIYAHLDVAFVSVVVDQVVLENTKSGPKFELRGHPLNNSCHSVPILTLFVLSEKYDLNRPITASEKPYALSFANNSGRESNNIIVK